MIPFISQLRPGYHWHLGTAAGPGDAAKQARFARTVDAWLSRKPIPPVESLVADSRLSRRQVERNCKALYGYPPKVLARKSRALCAAALIAAHPDEEFDWVESGFYDQPHMIREVKHFTGMTPGQIRRQ